MNLFNLYSEFYIAFALWFFLEQTYQIQCKERKTAWMYRSRIENAVIQLPIRRAGFGMWEEVYEYHVRCNIAKNAL